MFKCHFVVAMIVYYFYVILIIFYKTFLPLTFTCKKKDNQLQLVSIFTMLDLRKCNSCIVWILIPIRCL